MFYVGNLEYLLFYSTCRCREKNKFGWIRPKLFKKYLIERKYAKNWVSVLAVLAWSLYYGRTLRWDGWVAETTSLLRMRTGNCTEGSNPSLTANFTYVALIAQLDRALGYELRGREFESLWAHQLEIKNRTFDAVFLHLHYLKMMKFLCQKHDHCFTSGFERINTKKIRKVLNLV